MEDWRIIYKTRTTTPEEAVKLIKSGDRVVNSHLVGVPIPIIDAMLKNHNEYKNVEICCMLTSDGQPYAREEYRNNFHMNPWFVGKTSAIALEKNFGDFIPVHFSEIPGLLRTTMKPDVALIQVSPPDQHGYVSLGLSTDYMMESCKQAGIVIAEVNKQCPKIYGNTFLHVNDIDCFVETDRPIPEAPQTIISDVERRIGENCAEMISDGSCLQMGIGAIPDAMLGFLDNRKGLGIHSEIIGNGVIKLCEQGVITGEHKEIDKGKIVCTSLYGTKKLLDYANNNPKFELHPVDYTNDPRVISKISNMVSINSCVEIDLTGQVCSEAIGMRQISGIGGQVDFIRGAKMSKGGKSIIACYSTAKGGTLSKIVPAFVAGTPVTTSRTDVDYIVTEHGIAEMRGKNLRQRAKNLINVAEPKFREELWFEYKKLYGDI